MPLERSLYFLSSGREKSFKYFSYALSCQFANRLRMILPICFKLRFFGRHSSPSTTPISLRSAAVSRDASLPKMRILPPSEFAEPSIQLTVVLLPGAVLADKSDDGAFGNIERYVFEGKILVTFRQFANFYVVLHILNLFRNDAEHLREFGFRNAARAGKFIRFRKRRFDLAQNLFFEHLRIGRQPQNCPSPARNE